MCVCQNLMSQFNIVTTAESHLRAETPPYSYSVLEADTFSSGRSPTTDISYWEWPTSAYSVSNPNLVTEA